MRISDWSSDGCSSDLSVDISKLEFGQRLDLQWRGKPVWVIRRTPEQLEHLSEQDQRLRDPQSENVEQQPAYAQNEYRSIKTEILVLVGICTHLGCVPLFKPELVAQPFDPNRSEERRLGKECVST